MLSTEWHISPTPEFIRTSQTYEKKHPDELAATLANLFQRYLPRLNHARRHGLVHAGRLHHEGHGIIAIDQSGHGKSLSETRLYAYPHDESLTLHLLLIADKSSQKRDLRIVHEILKQLRQDRSHG
ncbi:MAG: hypothetical protein RJB43_1087 [Verrucomicrobiota bacterium]|jgi:hypothetical protein